ncbi:MAG: HAMP domain-containing sensor histidine kinase [Halodesulfurarchaeum sp.]|nr:HAMP domain-containing sensor histidine kinase [Halodesulfurarchaeum sp.]
MPSIAGADLSVVERVGEVIESVGAAGHWLLICSGIALMFGAELVFFVFGSASPVIQALELSLPIAVGVGLVWYGSQLRDHEFSPWQIAVLGFAVIFGMGLFVVIATYMRILLSLELSLTEEPVSLLLNAMAIGAVLNLVYAHQYVKIEARARRLENRVDRLGTVLSRASHDLRNPLNVAQGYADLIGDKLESNERVEPLQNALDRIGSIVDELLMFAHTNYTVESVECCSLEAVTRESWGMVESEAGTVEVESEFEFEADHDRLQHLLENLFCNAVEHAGPDPTVRVGRIDGREGFYVADNGPGIPEDERNRVFEPGFTTAEAGTGFGLNIVAEIGQAHDWDVEIADSKSGGTRFEFDGLETEGRCESAK